MKDFRWIVSVCHDLAAFAEKHGLAETTRATQSAATIASLEIKLAHSLPVQPALQSLAVTLPRESTRSGNTKVAGNASSSLAVPNHDDGAVVSLQSRL